MAGSSIYRKQVTFLSEQSRPATVESPRNLADDLLNLNSVNLRYSAIAGSPHSSAHDANITAVTPGTRKSQIPVVEQAIETAALMLGSNKSRGYCLEMICADFPAGACLDSGQPELLLHTISRWFGFLPGEQKQHSPNSQARACKESRSAETIADQARRK